MTQGVKTALRWIVLALLVAYCVVVCVWSSQEINSRLCPGVKVFVEGGGRTVLPEAVNRQVSAYRNFKGMRVGDINTGKVEEHLSRFNNFENVECAVGTDGSLLVKVVPLIPELRVFTRRGSYYINKDGKHIDANADFYVNVPIVTGNFNSSFRPTALLPLTRYIRNDSLLSNYITMIEARSPSDIILVPKVKGHVINIGDTENLPEKFARLFTMYRKVMPYKGWNTYDTISVKFKKMIVATRRDKTILNHGTDDLDGDEIEETTLMLDSRNAPASTKHKSNDTDPETNKESKTTSTPR